LYERMFSCQGLQASRLDAAIPARMDPVIVAQLVGSVLNMGAFALLERDQRARQLSGARAEVEDVAGALADEPARRLIGIPGAAVRIRLGDEGERRRRPAALLVAVDDHEVISAATPCMPTKRGATSRTLSRAQNGMSSASCGAWCTRFRPLFDARSASSAPLQVVAARAASSAASVRSQSSAAA